ncbi:MAG: FixH family protein [Candidatus Carbobacillus altaicus]|nr:FixH family protein [Candidatus Carbobacillus altaicus]
MQRTYKHQKMHSSRLGLILFVFTALIFSSACGKTSGSEQGEDAGKEKAMNQTASSVFVAVASDPNPAKTGKTIYLSAIISELKGDTMNPEKSLPVENAERVSFTIIPEHAPQTMSGKTLEAEHTMGGMYITEVQLDEPGTYHVEAHIKAHGQTFTKTTTITVEP